ncbi:histidine kinase dimerization/phosphoacceptor domain -containing protein [Methylobacterium sp. NEAU 140]|uniref:histidine kinase dimerization/phosphoacceptor domain -containing protein n=1 Tax=Methylobacterium sp. NEAU 140 TaxID=3064945 RepID=UPI0027327383|nr:histidine kinase dimerization/phosphoacceptor domain -containing protein [Methylobacterium sp. NEAU 140]MDP4024846.1 histidine kinase dimerization/phosphoacceptor domain -containing protein [Methylobacterium sp. NEAU 140]
MIVTDARAPDNPITWANDAFVAHTGYGLPELLGRNCRMLQGPGTDAAEIARIGAALAAEEPISAELLNYRKDGTPFWNAMTITPVRDADGVAYFYAAQADMSHTHQLELAMRGTNDELERQVAARTTALSAALEQKTALLHEVDHRVKNNLQVISSLMLLKARRTPEGEARDALQGMAERIGALSTAHRMLYAEGDCTHFDLGEFATELLSDINAGLDADRLRIEAQVEPIAVAAAMAAPLALLIHELTANALHHAFHDGRSGTVSITAQRHADGIRLTVRDDGVGLEAAPPNPAGFGRNLAEMVVRQLRGRIAWAAATPGTRVEIDIPLRGSA